MPDADTAPILFLKKMGGVALLILGLLLAGLGYSNGSNGLTVVGSIILVVGLVLLVLKIFRRNQP